MNKRKLGTEKEQIIVQYLEEKGIQILYCNYRSRFGEIDIIAKDKEVYIIVEVKYRADCNKGFPEEAVGYKKQFRICRVVDYFCMVHQISQYEAFRFDVIAICGDKIKWIQNAFDYVR